MEAFFFGAGSKTGATTGAEACPVAGLAAFFYLDPVGQTEDREEGSPPAGVLRFLEGQEEVGILIKNMK
jgi:hypothetical protein